MRGQGVRDRIKGLKTKGLRRCLSHTILAQPVFLYRFFESLSRVSGVRVRDKG
jgi:cyanate lyase